MIKSVYIHIPFCQTICSYCDFPKVFYYDSLVEKYLNSIEKEIKDNYNGELIDTLYIGGGTPTSLTYSELNRLFDILSPIKKSKTIEFTFEANVESLTLDKIKLLFTKGVNRISLGVQSFDKKVIKYLNRFHDKELVEQRIKELKQVGFKNISIDLIYGIKEQTLKDLEKDLQSFLKLDVNHISTYSLIIEPHTVLSINSETNIDEDLEYKMYQLIKNTLTSKGFKQYEISNYSKPNFESKHNLTYWNNNQYYGFGLGASGFINNNRYYNTKSINEYIENNYNKAEDIITNNENIENHLMLGLRLINGINIKEFNELYNINILNNQQIIKLINERKISATDRIYINEEYMYIMNTILVDLIGEKYE